jgi:hypothetical protein
MSLSRRRRPRTAGSPSIVPARFVQELDDDLGQVVGGGSFAGKEERTRRHVESRVLTEPVIQCYHAQRIQQLPFVFVDTLPAAARSAGRFDCTPLSRRPLAAPRRASCSPVPHAQSGDDDLRPPPRHQKQRHFDLYQDRPTNLSQVLPIVSGWRRRRGARSRSAYDKEI